MAKVVTERNKYAMMTRYDTATFRRYKKSARLFRSESRRKRETPVRHLAHEDPEAIEATKAKHARRLRHSILSTYRNFNYVFETTGHFSRELPECWIISDFGVEHAIGWEHGAEHSNLPWCLASGYSPACGPSTQCPEAHV